MKQRITALGLVAVLLGIFLTNNILATTPVPATDGEKITVKNYTFGDQSTLTAKGSIKISLKKGDNCTVLAKAPEELISYLNVEVSGSNLEISIDKIPVKIERKYLGTTPFLLEVTMPNLNGVTLAGSVNVNVEDNFVVESTFTANLMGSSSLKLKNIDATKADFTISGAAEYTFNGNVDEFNSKMSGASHSQVNATVKNSTTVNLTGAAEIQFDGSFTAIDAVLKGASKVRLSGNAQSLDANLTGASKMFADSVPIEDVNIEASGASSAKVNATNSLKIKSTGASSVKYKADDNVKVNVQATGVTRITE